MVEYDELRMLLKSKEKESEWLDYKEEWHKNTAELLKDILAFVNTTHHKDCYLIFGVRDKDLEIIGIDNDKNRKKTQNIIDMLGSKRLSNLTPKIEVSEFVIQGKKIDVLTIFETRNVPLFLQKEYRDGKITINIGQIFTRIGDTNTPINETADDKVVESLYKKRLFIDDTIQKRYEALIENVDDWTYFDNGQKILYNFDPNFYIVIEDYEDENNQRTYSGETESWLVNVSDFEYEWKIRKYASARFMYGEHEIFSSVGIVYFDRDRGVMIYPHFSQLVLNKSGFGGYYYYIEDDLDWKFMRLFATTWSKALNADFYLNFYSAKKVLNNTAIFKINSEKEQLESLFGNSTTLEDLEKYFGFHIIPTEKEISELTSKNKEYGKESLLRNNIGKAINKKLKEQRKL